MSRQAVYYHKMRALLMKALGPVCKECGRRENLTFDVIVPVGDPKSHHGRMSSSARASFYCHMFILDNLQVLCDGCNTRKGH